MFILRRQFIFPNISLQRNYYASLAEVKDVAFYQLELVKVNRPRSIYQFSNMAPRLSGQNYFCLSIPKGDLDIKKTTPNIEVCPESLGAMLQY